MGPDRPRPMPKLPARAVLAKRLKELRKDLGVSQAELGIRMGIPPDVASTRVNRYEKGVHAPDLETMEAMARELGVPLPYLVAQDERLAVLIRSFGALSAVDQDRVLKALERVQRNPTPVKKVAKKGAAKKAKASVRRK